MPGIPRNRPAATEDVIVRRGVIIPGQGIRVFREYRDATTGSMLRDDTDASSQFFTWADVEAELGAAQTAKVRRLLYKLLGATNAEADAAVAAEG